MVATKKTQPAMTVYLGPEPLAGQRMEALNRLAARLGVSRSKLICMIADGNLSLTLTASSEPLTAEPEAEQQG